MTEATRTAIPLTPANPIEDAAVLSVERLLATIEQKARVSGFFCDLAGGGVVIDDTSGFRANQMPYGGAKESGRGREGLHYAMEKMTEPRIPVLSDIPVQRPWGQ